MDAAPLMLKVGDVRVIVRSNDRDFLRAAGRSFVDLSWPAAADAPDEGTDIRTTTFDVRRNDAPWTDWGVWRDDEPCEITLSEDYVLVQLQWEINRVMLEQYDVTIHAAAAELDGCGLVLPGSTTSGKTTLAGWIGSHGGRFIADEVVALDTDRMAMRPYHRPLGIRPGGPLDRRLSDRSEFETRFDGSDKLLPMSELGGVLSANRLIPANAIVFPMYRSDTPSSLSLIPKSEAFHRLCNVSPGVAAHGAPVFSALAELVRTVPTLELSTNDLNDVMVSLRGAIAHRWSLHG